MYAVRVSWRTGRVSRAAGSQVRESGPFSAVTVAVFSVGVRKSSDVSDQAFRIMPLRRPAS